MSKDEKTKEKKTSDKSKKKKQNGIAKWFKDLKIEFKKVVWPTKKTVINNTAIVLAVVAASAVLVGLLDSGFLGLMNLIYSQK
jgi:preprotein translocase subunit SecE